MVQDEKEFQTTKYLLWRRVAVWSGDICSSSHHNVNGVALKNIHCSEFLLWLSGLRIRLVSLRMWVQSLALLSGLRIWHCHELSCRSQMRSDLALLWLWRRPVVAALIRPLAWECPYAAGAALIRKKKKIYCSLLQLPKPPTAYSFGLSRTMDAWEWELRLRDCLPRGTSKAMQINRSVYHQKLVNWPSGLYIISLFWIRLAHDKMAL